MKLLIADDHTLFRDALVQYLQRSMPDALIDIADDFYQVEKIVEKDQNWSLVLLDLKMPGMGGMQGFQSMVENYPDIKVALMSGVAEVQDVKNAMNTGAVGYFPKTMSGKSMVDAIRKVLGGKTFLPFENDGSRVMPSYYDDDLDKVGSMDDSLAEDAFNLTPREQEVLQYLAEGASNKEIAQKMDLQVVTIKLHVSGICRKLQSKNRTQAALRAKELGLAS